MKRILYGSEKEFHLHQQSIHQLAAESGLPETQIEARYDVELEKMVASTRVRDYLPLILWRRMRESLTS